MHVQNKTNALLLAIAKEELEKVVDTLLDCNPQLDLQDNVCSCSAITFCTCIYIFMFVVWRDCSHICLQDEKP